MLSKDKVLLVMPSSLKKTLLRAMSFVYINEL